MSSISTFSLSALNTSCCCLKYVHYTNTIFIEHINESHCCYFVSLERGLMILWVFHIIEGIVDIIVASVNIPQNQSVATFVMTMVVIGAVISFLTGYYGIIGTSRRDPKKVSIAYQLFVVSTIFELLGYLISLFFWGVLVVILIDGYLIYQVRKYLDILENGRREPAISAQNQPPPAT